jgi:GTPase
MFGIIDDNIIMKSLLDPSSPKFKLLSENDDGNIEYKLRLDKKHGLSLRKLITQMNWRLSEGYEKNGVHEAHYILGIEDDGNLGNMSLSNIESTYDVFLYMVQECHAVVVTKTMFKIDSSHLIYAMINKKHTSKVIEINAIFVGPSGHGKTTAISYLTHGCNDNGDGQGRKHVLKYVHEKVTGQTSSVKKEIIGLKNKMLINTTTGDASWEDIVNMSDKIVNLIDLPGDKKFSKTTYFGILSYKIHIMFIVVDIATLTDVDVSICIDFYYGLGKLLNVKMVLLLSKLDTVKDTAHISTYMYSDLPCVGISSVTEKGFDKIIDIFNQYELIPYTSNDTDKLFTVIEPYFIFDTGVVLSGSVEKGIFNIGDKVFITDGLHCTETYIKSIHKKQIDSTCLYEGETGCLHVSYSGKYDSIDKHMIVTNRKYPLWSKITILIKDTFSLLPSIKQKCALYIGNMMAVVKIISVSLQDDLSISLVLQVISSPILCPILEYKSKTVGILKMDSDEVYVGEVIN